MAIKEIIQKIWRGLQREMAGESNTVRVSAGTGWFHNGNYLMPYQKTALVEKGLHANQLEFERSKAVIVGPKEDIHRVRCLDSMIHNLTKPFNGAARVPEEVVEKVEAHIEDVSDSLKRIGAYKPPGIEMEFGDMLVGIFNPADPKQPLASLEYENIFLSQHGSEIRQRVAKFDIGARRFG
jgi:hypothetical protein